MDVLHEYEPARRQIRDPLHGMLPFTKLTPQTIDLPRKFMINQLCVLQPGIAWPLFEATRDGGLFEGRPALSKGVFVRYKSR